MKAILETNAPESCYRCWFKIESHQKIRCVAFKYLDEKYSSCGERKSRIIPKEYDFPRYERRTDRPEFCPLKIVEDTKADTTAAPVTETAPIPQISLRDYFAGQAFLGLLTNDTTTSFLDTDFAYRLADAMMKAREREVENE